jgi:hypothetical protein
VYVSNLITPTKIRCKTPNYKLFLPKSPAPPLSLRPVFFYFFERLGTFPSPSLSLFLPLSSGPPRIEALSLLKKEGLRERGAARERKREGGRGKMADGWRRGRDQRGSEALKKKK